MDIHVNLEKERVHLKSGRSTWGLMCYEGVHGDDRRMLRITPLLETWASPCKKQKQMGFKMDRLLYGPSWLLVFVLEGLVLEAAQDTLQLIAHSKEKKRRLQLNYGSSLVTFFNLKKSYSSFSGRLGIHQIRGCGTGCRHSHWSRSAAK